MTHKSDIAICVRGLSKCYTIAHNQPKHTTLGEALMHTLRAPRQKAEHETFWALQDVSFDIQQGDVVGIIGRNGAGKSTLLKILSRLTEPTSGQIDLYGRVGSLLEVGTGFHQELTGRENIYMNGAILGMSRREIARQFDAIVDFSGTEQFLDTPVKRYSSGMYVRLAFAVAAHLNPEILIVDEVLAVGDAEFQKKCLGKMQDVAKSGRSVLFVSHHMQSISLLCNRCILLGLGRIAYDGTVKNAINQYLEEFVSSRSSSIDPNMRPGSGEYRFTTVTIDKDVYVGDASKLIRFQLRRRRGSLSRLYLSGLLVNEQGVNIAQFDSRLVGFWLDDAEVIEGRLTINSPWLKPGSYRVDLYICSSGIVDQFEQACSFNISPVIPYSNSASSDSIEYGTVFSDFQWASQSVLATTLTKVN